MQGIAEGFDPNRKPKKREASIERYLVDQVKKIGGICYKFVSPGSDGVPDRIVIYNGKVVFVEIKRPGEKPRNLQKERIKDLRKQKVLALSINTKRGVEELIEYITKG